MLNNRNVFLLQNQRLHFLKRYPSLLLESVVFLFIPNNVHAPVFHIGYTTSTDLAPRAATADNSRKKDTPHCIFNVEALFRKTFCASLAKTLLNRSRFEFLLGGAVDTKLLDVRVFDTKIKRAAYAKQTQAAERKGESNCPLCAVGKNANKSRIYKFEEMDADHVTAWSKGGKSSAKNCQMLCITHNRAKGNR